MIANNALKTAKASYDLEVHDVIKYRGTRKHLATVIISHGIAQTIFICVT